MSLSNATPHAAKLMVVLGEETEPGPSTGETAR